jgi:hypothetical protein
VRSKDIDVQSGLEVYVKVKMLKIETNTVGFEAESVEGAKNLPS